MSISAGQHGHARRRTPFTHLARLSAIASTALLVAAATLAGAAHAQTPVAAYSFDEGSGATVSDSAGDHDGTIEGATRVYAGKYGSALEFDGVDDLVTVPDAAELDLTGSFTLEAWVKPDTTTAGPTISKAENVEGISGYALSARYAGKPTGHVADSGTIKAVSGPDALPVEAWSHIAATSDGTTLRLYIDGELVASASGIPVKATATSLAIGHSQILNSWFDGQIDEVRLYDEALSEGDIQVDRDTAVGLDQLPVAAYSFDEGSGTILGDSVNDHDGTIEGATWASEGKYGSALEFDGNDDLVTVPDDPELDLTGSFTLEAWVNPSSTAAARPVVSKGEATSGTSGYELSARYTTTTPAGIVAADGTLKSVVGVNALATDEWSHLAVTSDGTTLRLYVNGSQLANAPATASNATNAALEIGHSFLGGHFEGLIDELRLYDEVLSESQLKIDRDNRVEAPPSNEVKTTVLDSGPSAELISSVPITDEGTEEVVYSLEVPSLQADEILRIAGNLEVTNKQSYAVTDSVQLVLGSSPSDGAGTVISPWTRVQHKADMLHWTLPLNGLYRAPADVEGTRYLKVMVKAASTSATPGDTLIVQSNFGRLTATRYTPTIEPISQPTHELQSLNDSVPELITSVPADSNWHRVVTRKVGDLSANDILDVTAQLEVQNPNGTTATVESMIKMSTGPNTAGNTGSPVTADHLTSDLEFYRLVHTNQLTVSDPAKPYINLLVRVIPVGESAQPLAMTAGSATLNVLRMRPRLGDPTAPLREGTLQVRHGDLDPNVSDIPYAVGGGSEKRVVASAPLWGGLWNGEVLRGRGLVTSDLNGTEEVTQILTQLILGDSPTDTTGDVVATLSGDKLPPALQTHTSIKEGTYVISAAEPVNKYLNYVVYASQANPSGSMTIPSASVSYTRSKSTAPVDEGFETGLGTDGIDSVFKYEYNGALSASSAIEAREGDKSLLVDLHLEHDFPGDDEAGEIRRNEARPPDTRSAGGYFEEESWHGFSVYFPTGFDAPSPAPGASAGPWNYFSQFHHFSSENPILGCPGNPGGVPISFNVRHYKAGAHTNSGDTETATPSEGDYIEVQFRSGEIDENCEAVQSTQKYVLTPLEYDQWYDFVLHTRWTPLEGGPGNSVSEVWLDGQQVLGDESTPISMPTLSWRGTPDTHNNSAYWQFGLYRGPSLEDPPVKLYIDAVRSGDSYAEVAPGQ